jgi:hypothetical protein
LHHKVSIGPLFTFARSSRCTLDAQTDKKGRPINIQFLGAIDVPEIRKTVSAERHWQTIVVHAESLTREILPAASRRAGKPINECLVIVDLKGFSYAFPL